MKELFAKIKNNAYVSNFLQGLLSVLPIAICVSVFYLMGIIGTTDYGSFDLNALLFFLGVSLIAVIGLGLFQIGVDKSMSRMGTLVGETITKRKSMFLLVAMAFVLGFLVTMAEPDLTVLASQVGLPNIVVIVSVSAGTGLFLVIGVIRILLKKSLKIMFLAFYALVFALVALVSPELLPICFDSGGVSAGPVTVPFILSFGAGVAMSTHSKGSGEDSFGLSALCSVGPIIAVMALSLFLGEGALDSYVAEVRPFTGGALLDSFFSALSDVALAFGPLILFFLIYDLLFLRLSFKALLKILVGLLYGFFGLWLFLTAVNCAFWPTAQIVGASLGGDPLWMAILIAGVFGLLGVLAEPAVHVLVKQVETISDGGISRYAVLTVMAIGNALALVLAVLRVEYAFPIEYVLIPGYILIFVFMALSPNIYTFIAFDSGAVASGPMSSAFLLPFVIGLALSKGVDVYTYAFGVVALIAMMPLLSIEVLGSYVEARRKFKLRRLKKAFYEEGEDQIIHFGEVGSHA